MNFRFLPGDADGWVSCHLFSLLMWKFGVLGVVKMSGKIHRCPKCPYLTMYSPTLSRHIKAVHDKIKDLACGLCDFKTSHVHTLKKHIKVIHSKIKDLICGQCDYRTGDSSNYRTHVQNKHKMHLACDNCPFRTGHKRTLRKHMKRTHPSGNVTLDQTANSTEENSEEMKSNRPALTFKCPQCPITTTHKSSIKVHIKAVHDKIKDFTCELCNFATSRRAVLNKHVKNVHIKVKDLVCGACDYRTGDRGSYRTHIRVQHDKRKDFACDHCSYRAGQKSHLLRHIKVSHSNAKSTLDLTADTPKASIYENIRKESGKICQLCKIMLESEEKLTDHLMSEHVLSS